MKIKQTGFTLIELMIVVAILSILATLAQSRFTIFLAKTKQTTGHGRLYEAAKLQQIAYINDEGHLGDLPWYHFDPEALKTDYRYTSFPVASSPTSAGFTRLSAAAFILDECVQDVFVLNVLESGEIVEAFHQNPIKNCTLCTALGTSCGPNSP